MIEDYDRAAPKGVGAVKVAGNYAADMMPNMLAKQAGYPIGLYLDAKTNTLVEVSKQDTHGCGDCVSLMHDLLALPTRERATAGGAQHFSKRRLSTKLCIS